MVYSILQLSHCFGMRPHSLIRSYNKPCPEMRFQLLRFRRDGAESLQLLYWFHPAPACIIYHTSICRPVSDLHIYIYILPGRFLNSGLLEAMPGWALASKSPKKLTLAWVPIWIHPSRLFQALGSLPLLEAAGPPWAPPWAPPWGSRCPRRVGALVRSAMASAWAPGRVRPHGPWSNCHFIRGLYTYIYIYGLYKY